MKSIILLSTLFYALNIFAILSTEENNDPYFQQELELRGYDQQHKGLTWDVEPFQDQILYDVFHTENQIFNDVLMQTQTHIGVPYVWGGNSWTKGLDCSHYTRKIFQDVGIDYGPYIVTATMKNINNSKHFHEVSYADALPGDMLVYGYKSLFSRQWHGHVVILIDKHYRSSHGKSGLLAGAHGKVGVQFISYNGFPNFFRYPFYRLKKILRVKGVF